VFAATLVLLALLASPMTAQRSILDGRADELEAASKAGSAARALECVLSSGGGMELDFRREDVYHSVEQGRFHARAGKRLIEVDGVFHGDKAEPV
ncbi:MAG: hypothetical protein ACOY58_03180, partial [Candidatus Micrarchaeota archaeon]